MIEILFIAELAVVAGVVWHLCRGRRARRIIWARPPIEDKELERIFSEWQHDDERLRALLQILQEHMDTATGTLLARRGRIRDEAAGELAGLEALQARLVELLRKR